MNFDKKLEQLAQVVVKKGAVIEKNQSLVIQSAVEAAFFTRIVAKVAYQNGASEVFIDWSDDSIEKLKFQNESVETITKTFPWSGKTLLNYAENSCSFIKISTPDPDIFADIPSDIISQDYKVKRKVDEVTNALKMNGSCKWISLVIPSKQWAMKVFPNLNEDEALEILWNNFFDICRIEDEHSVENWEKHIENLTSKANYLTDKNLVKLHFKNSIGTDLMVELVKNHLWVGGTLKSKFGIDFVPNIPTEEVATAPYRTGVNGTLVSTKPLCNNGQIIDEFKLLFNNGKVIDFSAKVGYEYLKQIIETDEYSCYLGEVALVPYNSPIANKNILFYNTLYDENASCHFALGKGYPVVLKNNSNLCNEQIEELGLNNKSLIHVDFMVGSEDLCIVGYDDKNESIQIFENGNWAF